MDSATATSTVEEGPKMTDFFLAKLAGGQYNRYMKKESMPEGAVTYDRASVEAMTKEQVGELYGSLIGTSAKNFKDRRIAVDSLAFQISKLRPVDGPSVTVVPLVNVKKIGRQPRQPEVTELLPREDAAELLKEMAPQAREIISLFADIAAETGSMLITSKQLEEKLAIPEIVARFKTKQDPMRIIYYYRSKLTALGLIRVRTQE